MNDSTQNIDLVERYFDNEMTEEEKVRFHDSMKSNLELRHLFDREKLLINTIRFGAAKNHLDFFKELEKSLPDVTLERKTSPAWIYYAAAASVVILLVSGIYFFRANDPTPTELYAEYFTPYPNVFEPTVRGSEKVTKRALAFQKYEEGDYQQAAALFAALLRDEREPGMLLLLGNANLALGKTEEAKNNFNEVVKTSSENSVPAQWYLSLAYLRDGKISSAKETLTPLAETKNPYSKKAKDLLLQMGQ